MTTAFINGKVFVGDGRVLEHATVLVEGDRIVKVGKGKTTVPRGAAKIALDGGMLFPGFIDCHVHLCLDGSPDPVATFTKDPAPITTLKASRFAHKTLMSGVTMVRDMGGRDGIDLCLRDAIRSGLTLGPRMVVSRQMVCMTGGHGWPFGREADGPDEVRKAAREQIRGGADLVKFMATGGVMTPSFALLLADEPTTALDVTIQAQILSLMMKLKEEFKTSILLITHDLGVISEMASRVAVMYAGKIVEEAPVRDLFKDPRHPYTRGLLGSVPVIGKKAQTGRRLQEIPGMVPSPLEMPSGCSFHPRCPGAMPVCSEQEPKMVTLGEHRRVQCWLAG